MLQVQCPKCKNKMNYDPKPEGSGLANNRISITSKSKRCVYCGHTFKVHTDPQQSRIIKIMK